jgi:hypothetical protein
MGIFDENRICSSHCLDGKKFDGFCVSEKSRVGDSVVICLVEVSKGCPPGDERGKVYTTANLNTMEYWTEFFAQLRRRLVEIDRSC